MVISIFTKEEETTIRAQIIYGTGMLLVSLVTFWAASTYATVDLRYAFLFTCVLLAVTWMLNGLTCLADVYINIIKRRED